MSCSDNIRELAFRKMAPLWSITETPIPDVRDEIAELKEKIEELIYWVRPMTGNLVTGKLAVDEYNKLKGKM